MPQTGFSLDRLDTLDSADDYNKLDFGLRRDVKLTSQPAYQPAVTQSRSTSGRL